MKSLQDELTAETAADLRMWRVNSGHALKNLDWRGLSLVARACADDNSLDTGLSHAEMFKEVSAWEARMLDITSVHMHACTRRAFLHTLTCAHIRHTLLAALGHVPYSCVHLRVVRKRTLFTCRGPYRGPHWEPQ